MEISMRNIPDTADYWDVKHAICGVIHSTSFIEGLLVACPEQQGLANFDIHLPLDKNRGLRNLTRGSLMLPKVPLGNYFLNRVTKDLPVRIDNKKIGFSVPQAPSSPATLRKIRILEKTRFVDPDIQKKRETVSAKLRDGFITTREVDIGVIYQEGQTKIFSTEFKKKTFGRLWIDYEYKLFRIELGEPALDQILYNIVITFDNLRGMGIGSDHCNPYVAFGLHTPALFQTEHINRDPSVKKYRERLSSLNSAHARVAPYAHQIILYLYDDCDIEKISNICQLAGLRRPRTMEIEIQSRSLFTQAKLDRLAKLLRETDWKVAFQLEILLCNGLLNVDDITRIHSGRLHRLYKKFEGCQDPHHSVSQVLRGLVERLQARRDETVEECIKACIEKPGKTSFDPFSARMPSPGNFLCYHVTFTPTRMILEGPYITQSNRVIRMYPGFEHNFIRVDFREENRLQFRWEQDVNGMNILQERVGETLKKGFSLAGRHLEFLAYSSSALREHAVWFMLPFLNTDGRLVRAQNIRDSLGNFSRDEYKPAKLAARMAQAFTATNPGVKIRMGEWEEMPDLGTEPYLHTDGVGTISSALADKLWQAWCIAIPNRTDCLEPSAYQIRFLGYKGVVAIDNRLEGVKMCLRPSMNKFTVDEITEAEIEIVQPFERPITAYLNRPLVMLLEDRRIPADVFLKIQADAVDEVNLSKQSVVAASQFLGRHSLGKGYRLPYILEKLGSLGLEFDPENPSNKLDNRFLLNALRFAEFHVIRDIKHRARIQIKDSFVLVGVADEGPAYKSRGLKKLYCLPAGSIYACVQGREETEPRWLEGPCLISRNPVVHPGDVQEVNAIGKPPPEKICLFAHLKNVVVFSSLGKRSLPSMLGGGDLDGEVFLHLSFSILHITLYNRDIYAIIQYPPLLHVLNWTPAEYPPVETLDLGRKCDINDICDFVVYYIDSDVLGLLSDRHLTIADQSTYGTLDPSCLKLAALCSQSVDFSKNGVPVPYERCPRLLIPYKPDWHAAEVLSPRDVDYYESTRALGHLYRAVDLKEPPTICRSEERSDLTSSAITACLRRAIEIHLLKSGTETRGTCDIEGIFDAYQEELGYICTTHVITNIPGARLVEEEIVTGTISAKCTAGRWRADRIYRMRLNATSLVYETRRQLTAEWNDGVGAEKALGFAWNAWKYSVKNSAQFGANSFGLITLGVIFDALDAIAKVGGAGLSAQ